MPAFESMAPGVFVEERPFTPTPIRNVDLSTTVFVGDFESDADPGSTSVVSSWSEMPPGPGPSTTPSLDREVVRQFFANGGRRAVLVATSGRDRTASALLHSLRRAEGRLDEAGQLAIPAFAELNPTEFASAVRVTEDVCRRRRCLFLVDPPADAPAVGGPNTATYLPAVTVRAESGHRMKIPASGTVAGVIARFDADRGVWSAPAGTAAIVRGATVDNLEPEPGELDRLNRSGVNLLRRLGQFAVVVWGARTGAGGESDYRYVPVRRVALLIERSIGRSLEWAVFEPNDEPLWTAVEATVADFLHRLFRQGAFAAGSPRDAYFVKCGSETTTQSDLDSGRLIVEVGFAPLQPAEFVVIRLELRAAPRSHEPA